MHVLLLEDLVLVLLHELGERADVVVGLLEQVGQAFVLLLVDELAVALLVLGHEQLHALLLEALLLLLLYALGVGVPVDDRLGHAAHARHIGSMRLAHRLRVLHYRVQVLLVLLAPLALGLLPLLALHLLGDARLAQRLPLAALVGLRVERRLERRVGAHARHDVVAQLLLQVEQAQRLQLDVDLEAQLVALDDERSGTVDGGSSDGQALELADAVGDLLRDDVLALAQQLVRIDAARTLHRCDLVRRTIRGHWQSARVAAHTRSTCCCSSCLSSRCMC